MMMMRIWRGSSEEFLNSLSLSRLVVNETSNYCNRKSIISLYSPEYKLPWLLGDVRNILLWAKRRGSTRIVLIINHFQNIFEVSPSLSLSLAFPDAGIYNNKNNIMNYYDATPLIDIFINLHSLPHTNTD